VVTLRHVLVYNAGATERQCELTAALRAQITAVTVIGRGSGVVRKLANGFTTLTDALVFVGSDPELERPLSELLLRNAENPTPRIIMLVDWVQEEVLQLFRSLSWGSTVPSWLRILHHNPDVMPSAAASGALALLRAAQHVIGAASTRQ
jgi:hypothetical protein